MTAQPKNPPNRHAVRRPAKVQSPPPSKKQTLISLLRQRPGADINQLSEAVGWKPHSVRAALVGLAKTGVEVERLPKTKPGPQLYRIAQNTKAPK